MVLIKLGNAPFNLAVPILDLIRITLAHTPVGAFIWQRNQIDVGWPGSEPQTVAEYDLVLRVYFRKGQRQRARVPAGMFACLVGFVGRFHTVVSVSLFLLFAADLNVPVV